MSFSLHAWAIIGEAPVPVPPPIPAVMKTMSASPRTSLIWSRSSIAASFASWGLPPEPKPLDIPSPIWSFVGASDLLRSWKSVFTVMNSTSLSPLLIMVLTAFPPAPPVPTTLILALLKPLSTFSILKLAICLPSSWISPLKKFVKPAFHSCKNVFLSKDPCRGARPFIQACVLNQAHSS